MANIYDRRQDTINGTWISMIRADDNLHAGDRPTTGEVAYYWDEYNQWEILWTGAAGIAGDVFRWVRDNLASGSTISEIDDYIMDNPEKFGLA